MLISCRVTSASLFAGDGPYFSTKFPRLRKTLGPEPPGQGVTPAVCHHCQRYQGPTLPLGPTLSTTISLRGRRMAPPRRLIFTHRHGARRHRCKSSPPKTIPDGESGPRPQGPRHHPLLPPTLVRFREELAGEGVGTERGARLSHSAGCTVGARRAAAGRV